jgi:hypothetical protein
MNDDLIIPLGTSHPDLCPECGDTLVLKDASRYGAFYGCVNFPNCLGTAAAHADGRPMGKAVNKKMKEKRVLVHKMLASLQKEKRWSRDNLYDWLDKLFPDKKHAHIADLDNNEIKKVIRYIQEEINNVARI